MVAELRLKQATRLHLIPGVLLLVGLGCLFVLPSGAAAEVSALFTGAGLSALLLNTLFRTSVRNHRDPGWLPAGRLSLSADGGPMVSPSGVDAFANSGDNDKALMVQALDRDDPAQRRAASRRQMIEAVDAEHARLARDLHDGAQQRLVHTIIALKMLRRALQDGDEAAEALVSEALEHAEQANAELRELAHGRLPSVLTHGGLRAGVEALASRAPLPVMVDVSVGRLARTLEAHAYFIVAEALTNVVKHSRASAAEVRVAVAGDVLRMEVHDNGIGGARFEGSSGLLGLGDRVASLQGQLRVTSPDGGGTQLVADLPLPPPVERTPRRGDRLHSGELAAQ
jgi:signal transduction histidine kinase